MDEVAEAIDKLTFGAGRGEGPSAGEPAFHRILLGLDPSEGAQAATLWAVALARAFRAPIVATHVIPAPYTALYDVAYGQVWPLASEYERVKQAGQRILEEGVARLRALGVEAEGAAPVGSAPRELARTAEAHAADVIVVGSHGRGALERAFLGSVSDGVRNRTRASVLIARGAPPPRSVLAGVDGSRASKDAARLALRLAREWRAPATIVHAVEPLEPDFLVDQETLAGMAAPPASAEVSYLRRAGPAGRVLAQAARDTGAGLVVVGSRGLGAWGGRLMGSTSSAVCHQAPCSVLVYREPGA